MAGFNDAFCNKSTVPMGMLPMVSFSGFLLTPILAMCIIVSLTYTSNRTYDNYTSIMI